MTRDVLPELEWRGLVADVSDRDGLSRALAAGPVTLYAGFDPTADSLHLGNLQVIVTLRHFQLAGHRVIALSGGGTGLIGDPSGKSAERQLNEAETVAEWTKRIGEQLSRLLPPGPGAPAVTLLDNDEWIGRLTAIELLRDVGKHFPLGYMLAKESVSARLGPDAAGMTFTEFSYMLLQALDCLVLYDREGCRLQIGGSDQWGNITAGLELLRRTERQGAFGLTMPLIVSSEGKKFGKSEAGALWLDPSKTSPYAFYQFLVNVPDADAGMLLRRLTFLTRDEIETLERAVAQRPAAREAQRALAREVTRFVHGDEGLAEAERASAALFGGDAEDAPVTEVGAKEASAWDRLAVAVGLAASLSDARRTIAAGGLYVGERRVGPEEAGPSPDDFDAEGRLFLRKGKRHRAVAKIAQG